MTHLRKPRTGTNGKHHVDISESISPLSPVIETMDFNSAREAWKAYWRMKKDRGERY